MELKPGNYIGEFIKSTSFKNFNLAITRHTSGKIIPAHSHKNTYLSLLLKGSYNEKNNKEEITIKKGNIIYRPSHYKHQNNSNNDFVCFNLDIKAGLLENLKDGFIDIEYPFTYKKINIEFLKLYYYFRAGYQADIVENLVYESLISISETDYLKKEVIKKLSGYRKYWA